METRRPVLQDQRGTYQPIDQTGIGFRLAFYTDRVGRRLSRPLRDLGGASVSVSRATFKASTSSFVELCMEIAFSFSVSAAAAFQCGFWRGLYCAAES